MLCHRLTHRLKASTAARTAALACPNRRLRACTATTQANATHTVTRPEDVPTPLCKRRAVHEAPLEAVLAWHASMRARVSKVGDTFEQQDLGPSESELMRQLDWVLDDSIAAVRYEPSSPWQPCSWRFLELELRAAARQKRDISSWQLQLRASVAELYDWWALRLEERVPFQYLIASSHWRQHVLSVGPGVLIPRPETEIFADLVEGALQKHPGLASLPWVDMGTGSGAIAIAAAEALQKHNRNGVRVFAVDLSPTAAAYAAANARATGHADCIHVLCGSWFEPVAAAMAGSDSSNMPGSAASSSDQAPPDAAHAHSSTHTRTGHSQPASPAQTPQHSSQSEHTASAGCHPGQQHHFVLHPPSLGAPPASPQQSQHQQTEQRNPGQQGSGYAERQHTPRACLGGIVSNPPYIPRPTMLAGLQAEVGQHEPWSALDGGAGQGLDSIQTICSGAVDLLAPGGFIALETAGRDQVELVADLLRGMQDNNPQGERHSAFEDVRVVDDCFGVPRFVTASRCVG